MEENKQIELRSEKVRNIIGQVPPVLLRYGISIIGLSLLMLVAIAAFLPYQPAVDVTVRVEQNTSGRLIYTGFIPWDAMGKKAEFTEVVIYSASDFNLSSQLQIEEISDTAHVSHDGTWHLAMLIPESDVPYTILLEKPVTVPAKINLKEMSVLKWILKTPNSPSH